MTTASNIPKIVLLNGPPRAGKDTIAQQMVTLQGERVRIVKFANELKKMAHAAFGLVGLAPDAYEGHLKDTPIQVFHGKTPRQTYIALSELFVKPFLGQGFFGAALRRTMREMVFSQNLHAGHVFAVSDSGFAGEAQELISWVGAPNVLLVRIHRPGTSFEGDSRSYIELPDVRTIDVQNDTFSAPREIARHILKIL